MYNQHSTFLRFGIQISSLLFSQRMATVSEQDICGVTDALGPDELQFLFHNLGINQRDIDVAEKEADTTNPRLKARAVLRWWRQTKGREATREALDEAKEKAFVQGKTNPRRRESMYTDD